MYLACAGGHAEIAQLLHAAGASVDEPNSEGKLPLHCAAEDGCAELVEWLLGLGCDPAALTDTGETPLYLACDGGRGSDGAALEVAQLLFSAAGETISVANDDGRLR